jgi:hypothetical protein
MLVGNGIPMDNYIIDATFNVTGSNSDVVAIQRSGPEVRCMFPVLTYGYVEAAP